MYLIFFNILNQLYCNKLFYTKIIKAYRITYTILFSYCTDYNVTMGVSGELTIFPGQLSSCVLVDITRDSIDEEPETFTFTISNANIPDLSDQTSSVTVTILDQGQLTMCNRYDELYSKMNYTQHTNIYLLCIHIMCMAKIWIRKIAYQTEQNFGAVRHQWIVLKSFEFGEFNIHCWWINWLGNIMHHRLIKLECKVKSTNFTKFFSNLFVKSFLYCPNYW